MHIIDSISLLSHAVIPPQARQHGGLNTYSLVRVVMHKNSTVLTKTGGGSISVMILTFSFITAS